MVPQWDVRIMPNKLTLMVLVGARTTFPARVISKKKIQFLFFNKI